MDNSKIKVLYIAGANRSGSTILHNILGQIDGFVALGEARDIWLRGFIQNRHCGCGVPFRECHMWHTIIQAGFGGLEQVDALKLYRLTESIRIHHFPLMVIPRVRQKRMAYLSDYFEHVEKLYAAVQATTGARVIVDSSKNPAYGYVLHMASTIDPYVVQLIRDPRGVGYSLTKKRVMQPGTTDLYLPQKRPTYSALQWNARNITAEMFLKRNVKRYMMLRYEEFVEQPKQVVKRILNLLGESVGELPFEAEHTVALGKVSHSVFGNPVRFQTGTVEISLDEQWKTKMNRTDKTAVTTLTWPLLIKYGYWGIRRSNRHPP